MQRSIDILGLGAVAVDDFYFVQSYPAADTKTPVLRHERHCGGLTATALAAAARLGARCAYAGLLGDDPASCYALDRLQSQKIDITRVKRVRGVRPVSSCIVVGQDRGTRNIFYDLKGVKGAGERWPPPEVISSCRVLLVDNIGVTGMIRAARFARQQGIPVVADFENARDPRFPQLLALANHLIISHSFATRLTGLEDPEKALQKLWAVDRETVVVTVGESGYWYRGQEMACPRHEPAFSVEVVDTTGCGDVFHGAYAFGLVKGMPLAKRLRLAAATAALKAKHLGGQAGLPSLSTVKKFLRQATNAHELGV